MKTWPAKDPDEQLNYTYRWADDLADGETITSVPMFAPIDAAGTVLVGLPLITEAGKSVTVVVSGGTNGLRASWTIRVQTSAGNLFEDIVALPIVSTVASVVYPGGYVAPTPNNLVALFPEFATLPESQLAYYLSRAAQSVDLSWVVGDFGHARMLLAAHLLTLAGLGTSSEAAAIRSGADQFKSMGIASLSLVRFDKAKDRSTFSITRYGTEFAVLLRRNRGGPRVAGSIARGYGDGDNFGPWTA